VTRILRCAACTRRIKPTHAHVGLIDLKAPPGREISYHARPDCQQRGGEEMASHMQRGRVYVLRHYHASTCPDRAPSWGCSGGCFDAPLAVAN